MLQGCGGTSETSTNLGGGDDDDDGGGGDGVWGWGGSFFCGGLVWLKLLL